MSNAGEYNKKIIIYKEIKEKDKDGFPQKIDFEVLKPYAKVKTTKGYTIIKNDSNFEKAYTNFTIRYPKTEITRDMKIKFKNKHYSIEYLNNIDEENVELEIQAKEITH